MVKCIGKKGPTEPPCTNRGVIDTGSVLEAVDWLSLTLGDDMPVELWGSILGIQPDEWEERGYGGYMYAKSKSAHGVVVYYHGAPGMGSHCRVSGQACRDLEARGVVTDWQAFAKMLLGLGVTATRLDANRDDHAGILHIDELIAAGHAGHVTKRAHEWEPKVKYGSKGRLKAHGLVFGNRQSESFVRIYDKALEQQVPGHWVRVELELKGKKAMAALRALAMGGLSWLAGAIREQVEFKLPSTDGNRSRAATLPAWDAFLSGAAKVKLAVERTVRTLSKVVYHLERQWAPLMATAMENSGGDTGWLYEIVRAGRRRMREQHWRLVEASASVPACVGPYGGVEF